MWSRVCWRDQLQGARLGSQHTAVSPNGDPTWNMLCFSGSSCEDHWSPLPVHMGVMLAWAEDVRWEASLFTAPQFGGVGQISKKRIKLCRRRARHREMKPLGHHVITFRLEGTVPNSQIKASFWLTTSWCTPPCCAHVGELAHLPLHQVPRSLTRKLDFKRCSPSSNPGCILCVLTSFPAPRDRRKDVEFMSNLFVFLLWTVFNI